MRDQFNLSGKFQGAKVHIRTGSGGRQLLEAAAAWARFAELPLDTVPKRSTLPPGSVMPWPPNALFVARSAELMKIAQTLAKGGSQAVCRVAALTGIGGIGKTQLAVEFAHRYGSYFAGGVYWISCQDPQSIAAQVAACGRADAMDLRDDFLELPVDEQARLVAETWRASYPRLLIFDNCEDEKTLASWRPQTGGARLLITSRRAQWSPALGIDLQSIAVVPREASLRLLGSDPSVASDVAMAFNDIAEELGDLPLALHLAGSFLNRYRHSPIGDPLHYLGQLRSLSLSHPSLEQGDWSPTGHEQHVAKTFELSYRQLLDPDSGDETVRSMLGGIACLAPGELVPRAMLHPMAAEGRSEEEVLLTLEAAIRRAADLGLIEDRAGELVMHRLVSAYVQAKQGPVAQRLIEESFLLGLTLLNTGELRSAGLNLSVLGTKWEVHLNHVVSRAVRADSSMANALLASSGRYFYNQGNYQAAQALQRQRLSRVEAEPGASYADLRAALNDLAISLRPFEPVEATSLLRRSLGLPQEAVPESRDLVTTYINLGLALAGTPEATGAFEAAQSLLERHGEDVAEDERAFWRTARVRILTGLAHSYERADSKRGQTVLENALKGLDLDRADGSDGELLAALGIIRYQAGDLRGAKESLERALPLLERHVGDSAPLMGDPLLHLGMVYQELQQPAAARPVLERALDLAETMVGPAHGNTLLTARTLGQVLIDLRQIAAAHALLKKTIDRVNEPDVSDGDAKAILVNLLFMYGMTCGEVEGPIAARNCWTHALQIARKHHLRDEEHMLSHFLREFDRRHPRKR